MKNESFQDWLNDFQQHALTLNERRLVVLVGDILWAKSLLLSAPFLPEIDQFSPFGGLVFAVFCGFLAIFNKSSTLF